MLIFELRTGHSLKFRILSLKTWSEEFNISISDSEPGQLQKYSCIHGDNINNRDALHILCHAPDMFNGHIWAAPLFDISDFSNII